MIGKKIKIERFRKSKSFIIVLPLDHAITNGILDGLEDPLALLDSLDSSVLNATILNKGWLFKEQSSRILANIPFFLHLSASVNMSNSNKKVFTTSILEAIKVGADGVSIHINFDEIKDNSILTEIGKVVEEANNYGLPVLAMMYVKELSESNILHIARIGEELGVDYIKLPYFNEDKFLKKLSSTIQTPLLIAGGKFENDFSIFLEKSYNSMESGLYGIIAGRNIFQRNNPRYCLFLLNEVLSKKIEIKSIDKTDIRLGKRNV